MKKLNLLNKRFKHLKVIKELSQRRDCVQKSNPPSNPQVTPQVESLLVGMKGDIKGT